MRYFLVCFWALPVFCLSSSLWADEARVVRLGGDYGYPPYEYLDDNGKAEGFNVALVQAIAEREGWNLEVDLGPWELRRRGIESGDIDILPMFVSERRTAEVDFATPHVMVYHELFVPRGQTGIDSFDDLAGREVIVQRAAYAHDVIQDADLGIYPVLVETERDAIRLLASGRYDAALVSQIGGRQVLRELGFENLTTTGPPILPVEYALAVRRGNTEMLDLLNENIAALRASGQFNRLYDQWLGPPSGPGWGDVLRYLGWLMALMVMLGLMTLVWITSLRRQVAQRTRELQRELKTRQATERALRESEADARATFEHAGAGIARLGLDGELLSVNGRLCAMLGLTRDDIEGQVLSAVTHESDLERLEGRMEECLAQQNAVFQLELRLQHRDGQSVWVTATLTLVRGTDGEPRHFILIAQDLTEVRELAEELDYHSRHDRLTGLLNRTDFERQLARLIESSRQEGREHALFHLDIDQFKLINETTDHATGDDLLRQIALRMRMMLGSSERIARLGGDEFAVLLPDTDPDQANRVAETLRRGVERMEFRIAEGVYRVTTSIGLVSIRPDAVSAGDVLKQGDAACYAAKDEGRNRIHVYEADDDRLLERHGEMRWAKQVLAALEEDRFELHYQTIQCVGDPERLCLEVLLRMLSPEGERISAGLFMPAAERYSVANRVDRWVVDHVLDWVKANPGTMESISLFTVNLSGRSLGDEAFLDRLSRRVRETGVPTEKLCFEITETAAIANLSTASGAIRRLRELGCRFALDDFGIGQSSMAYLKHLPADFLKIDGSFVRDILDDPRDRAMVAEINDLGHIMGKQTIAEHVENDAILAELRSMNVDMVQGYGISRPQPLSQLTLNAEGRRKQRGL
ncbi:EAL domain-containing protein [Natronospira bacteriovora]|uniref:EAL domain-containing protein n=1 Tax=Natronospira bacteriovora TaxID=3069753 RepID=A0ABU0WC03_9GAMM|nr:EAL domain-containing protein [Natronospira sp. AB-CW4]MDQ2070470.1 EAL domain-containing protein [Natronospira sp. AB-CW4]